MIAARQATLLMVVVPTAGLALREIQFGLESLLQERVDVRAVESLQMDDCRGWAIVRVTYAHRREP